MPTTDALIPITSHIDPAYLAVSGPAVFIDRDGVVNEQRTGKYVHSWRDFVFLPGAIDAFVALAAAGLPTFVVTNQGGVGRGFLTARSLEDIHDRMAALIRGAGGRLDAIIHCPHSPESRCKCRKPRPGMLHALAERFAVQLDASTFIGDNVTDLEAGRDAGCETILVSTGEGRRSAERLGLQSLRGDAYPWTNAEYATPVRSNEMDGLVATAPNLSSAVLHIIGTRQDRLSQRQ